MINVQVEEVSCGRYANTCDLQAAQIFRVNLTYSRVVKSTNSGWAASKRDGSHGVWMCQIGSKKGRNEASRQPIFTLFFLGKLKRLLR